MYISKSDEACFSFARIRIIYNQAGNPLQPGNKLYKLNQPGLVRNRVMIGQYQQKKNRF